MAVHPEGRPGDSPNNYLVFFNPVSRVYLCQVHLSLLGSYTRRPTMAASRPPDLGWKGSEDPVRSSLHCPATSPKEQLWVPWGPDTSSTPVYLAILGVGQDLVLFLGVENQSLHREGDELLLEGGPLIRAEEQTLVPVTERGAQQDDLEQKAGWT